jgi:hypothetical protein
MIVRTKIEKKFAEYLRLKSERLGVDYGPYYIKDKLSRLRTLMKVVSEQELEGISLASFVLLVERIKRSQEASDVFGKGYRAEGDYLRVLRLIFEMKTRKQAPRYTHYGNRRNKKYREISMQAKENRETGAVR